ncbi:MAG: hypothetical protein GY940_05655 [bacterium]|nr:hypothetical protein [bacterium]
MELTRKKPITEEIPALNFNDDRDHYDRGAFYFLTAVLIIIVALYLFETEILQFLFSKIV